MGSCFRCESRNCLILAGLGAEGTTRITGVEHIERGYENIIEVFSELGADIKICENCSTNEEDT